MSDDFKYEVSEVAKSSLSNYRRDFSGLTTDIGGRPGLRQIDYDWFRPEERVPTNSKDIISFGRYAYRRIGLIRNSIDLMGDFACQGIRLAHRNKRIENFYNKWFEQVEGQKVSERFCNLLFREANAVVKMQTAKINSRKREEMKRAIASPDMQLPSDPSLAKNEIPWKYNFLDPILVDVVGGAIASLVNGKQYAVKIPPSFATRISSMMQNPNSQLRELINKLPEDVRRAVQTSSPILLDPDKTFVYHYKKDDWQDWADPMTYAAYRDLILYEKLKLADQAALDGAISKSRVWKNGNREYKLPPTPEASETLNAILGANVQGGTKDIVWGPDIELIETSSDVQAFLGEEKYRPTLMAIYACIGIPPTLTGTFGASGTTNNFISLKTLTERLNYARSILLAFWKQQIKLVQKAMGFRYPATVEFDFMNLEDTSNLLNLLLNMVDRNILSDEFVQKFVKANPEIENRRIKDEGKRKTEKVSPFHQADKQFQLKKISLQTGITTPSQVGLELDDKNPEEKSALDLRNQSRTTDKKVGVPGRPPNSQDKQKRKQKTFKPALKAAIELWAKDAQEKIADLVNPGILSTLEKDSMRSLTASEFNNAEKLKFDILMNMEPMSEVNMDSIFESVNQPKQSNVYAAECEKLINETQYTVSRKLTIDEIRSIKASFYANYYVSK